MTGYGKMRPQARNLMRNVVAMERSDMAEEKSPMISAIFNRRTLLPSMIQFPYYQLSIPQFPPCHRHFRADKLRHYEFKTGIRTSYHPSL